MRVGNFNHVVSRIINGGVKYSEAGGLSCALNLHTVSYLQLGVIKVPCTLWRRSANEWQVNLKRFTSKNADRLLRKF